MALEDTLPKVATTVAISDNSANTVIAAATTGKRAVIYHLMIENRGTAGTNLTFKSGAGALTGAIPVNVNEVLELKNAPFPVFIGSAVGDALSVDNSATEQIDGFALVVYGDA